MTMTMTHSMRSSRNVKPGPMDSNGETVASTKKNSVKSVRSCTKCAGCVISTCKTTSSHSHMFENETSRINEFSTYSQLLRCMSSGALRFIAAFSRPAGDVENVLRNFFVQTLGVSHLLLVFQVDPTGTGMHRAQ